jgi:phage tail sheath protein FI
MAFLPYLTPHGKSGYQRIQQAKMHELVYVYPDSSREKRRTTMSGDSPTAFGYMRVSSGDEVRGGVSLVAREQRIQSYRSMPGSIFDGRMTLGTILPNRVKSGRSTDMPEYLSPGVYVKETSPGARPIEGVNTSTAGFLGPTERGPEPPRRITSWLDFHRWYGGYIPETSFLAYAVQGFFVNGGQRCYVARIVAADADATSGAVGNLNLTAIGRGSWGNNIMIKVDDATRSPKGQNWFRVSILYYRDPPNFADFVDPTSTDPADLANPNRTEPDVLEVYDNITHERGSNSVIATLNASSRLVRVEWGDGEQARLPNQDFTQLGNNGSDSAGGNNITVPDFQGDPDPIGDHPEELLGRGRGLAALETVDEISMLLAPDEVRLDPENLKQLSDAVIGQCQLLKDRFALISVERGQRDPGPLPPTQDMSYAALYTPWISIFDPSANERRLIPPTGHVAGIYARTDIERGVHKAPANEVVRGALDLEFPVTKDAQDILNSRGINCIRDFRSDRRGIRLWSARTMSSHSSWKYVNVRRLFLFVEESIDEGTQWVVFEPNHEPTWAKVRRNITNFLITVWRSGALMGATLEEAFFVKCDRTTMTQDDIDNGRLICHIGIAPIKPAEFVIFRISQKTADAEV